MTTAGMRGTCSCSYTLTAFADPGQVLREDVGTLSAATMLPVSHVLWASVWLGIAASALSIARDFVRTNRTGPSVPARRRRLGQAEVHFRTFARSSTGPLACWKARAPRPCRGWPPT